MTRLTKIEITCAICGKQSEHTVMSSTSEFGARDLDSRPADPARWSMSWWVRECPNCGYASQNLDKAKNYECEVVGSDEYKAVQAEALSPPNLRLFLLAGIIAEKCGDKENAARYALWSAWVIDDTEDKDAARPFRNKAADLFLSMMADREFGTEEARTHTLKIIDILRRAQRWDEAISLASNLLARRDTTPNNRIVAGFQISLSENQDDECYTSNDALGVEIAEDASTFDIPRFPLDETQTLVFKVKSLLERGVSFFR
jgi:uncharacterized protein (DUF2225 family)